MSGIGLHIITPKSAAATAWWLSGGIPAANCIAAYQAKGAASYSASKVNLANPGTYDITDPAGAVTWDAVNGWAGVSGRYLSTNVVVTAQTWSCIIRFSNSTLTGSQEMCGHFTPSAYFMIRPSNGGAVQSYNGNSVSVIPALAAGVYGIAGTFVYRNGILDGGPIAGTWGAANSNPFLLFGSLAPTRLWSGIKFQALVLYNTTIAAPQNLAVATAMAAL